MSKKIEDTEFLTSAQIRQARKDRKSILKSYGSFHAKLVSLFEPRMAEFKARFSKKADIKAARLAYNTEMRQDETFEELYSDKANGSLRQAISHAWKTVEGGKVRRTAQPKKGAVDTVGTVEEMKGETSAGQFLEIAALMYMALSPKQVKAFDDKMEALHARALRAA